MSSVKDLIDQAVDRLGDDLEKLSRPIHGHPELAYEEVKAAGWLTEFLGSQGLTVERGRRRRRDRVPRDDRDGRRARPSRSCASTTRCPRSGTRAATTRSPRRAPARAPRSPPCATQLPKGRVQVIGTPAEEGGGGKVKLIKAGVFADVDAAMMCHGWDRWILHQDLLGIVRVAFEFTGKAAHAAADPWEGVNALDAVIQTFNNVSMLRQQVKPSARIHGIVTSGGAAPNIIPEFAACLFYVRAADLDVHVGAPRPRRRVRGRRGESHRHHAEGDRLRRQRLRADEAQRRRCSTPFALNLRALGETESPEVKDRLGSSDVGNVSQVIPVHPAADEDRAGRHADPLARLRSGGGRRRSRARARSRPRRPWRARTYDLLADPALLAKAKQEFARRDRPRAPEAAMNRLVVVAASSPRARRLRHHASPPPPATPPPRSCGRQRPADRNRDAHAGPRRRADRHRRQGHAARAAGRAHPRGRQVRGPAVHHGGRALQPGKKQHGTMNPQGATRATCRT